MDKITPGMIVVCNSDLFDKTIEVRSMPGECFRVTFDTLRGWCDGREAIAYNGITYTCGEQLRVKDGLGWQAKEITKEQLIAILEATSERPAQRGKCS